MFTAELKINGVLIAVLYGHNESVTNREGTLYTYVYHEIGRNIPPVAGELRHPYENGLASLVAKCLAELPGPIPIRGAKP